MLMYLAICNGYHDVKSSDIMGQTKLLCDWDLNILSLSLVVI